MDARDLCSKVWANVSGPDVGRQKMGLLRIGTSANFKVLYNNSELRSMITRKRGVRTKELSLGEFLVNVEVGVVVGVRRALSQSCKSTIRCHEDQSYSPCRSPQQSSRCSTGAPASRPEWGRRRQLGVERQKEPLSRDVVILLGFDIFIPVRSSIFYV